MRARRQNSAGGGMERPAIERVMVITAHPDDSEFGAGGTVAKHVKDGREVTYVIATNGNKGSSDRTMTPEHLARTRETEQRNAARALGVDISEVMDLKLKALACHQSQFKDFAGVEERVRERAAELGKPKNYAFAEAFDRIFMPR